MKIEFTECDECGHEQEDHEEGTGACDVRGCRCDRYEAP